MTLYLRIRKGTTSGQVISAPANQAGSSALSIFVAAPVGAQAGETYDVTPLGYILQAPIPSTVPAGGGWGGPPPELTLAGAKQQALLQVDQRAEQLRSAVLPVDIGHREEHRLKFEEAHRYARGDMSGNFPFLDAERHLLGTSRGEVAELILLKAEEQQHVLQAVAKWRRELKLKIGMSEDISEVKKLAEEAPPAS
jgi:hypothetical protein